MIYWKTPESRHIGIFIHDLLQEAFRGFVGKKPLLDEDFRKYFQKIMRPDLPLFLAVPTGVILF